MAIKALGFDPENLPKLFKFPELQVSKWGTIKINLTTMETNVAGIFAAAMSTLSSSINSLASATVVDWIEPLKKNTNLKTARWISIFWAIVLIGGAMLFTSSDSPLVEVGLSIASVIYGAILGFFIIRLFNLKVTNHSVLLGFMISIISMIFIWRMSPLAWTWYVFTGTVIMLFISILLPYIKKIK